MELLDIFRLLITISLTHITAICQGKSAIICIFFVTPLDTTTYGAGWPTEALGEISEAKGLKDKSEFLRMGAMAL
tara:strand:- start:46 stop:270 length:225 start_codon:yes stop_codon:yes gene_type:complete